ncbi:ribosomal protein S18 acetylase RimI-like enzyme [Paenibacillus baekrokdamisoli]|uniref:GNAT family N-acetyltransferase n=1 Tax=Paenibacillus baekrokdamisoli TaxID=1712516 RepID=UPI0017BE22E2|nr:GNAT family N-acetyltransferase [Paenibacillus baekrokdamisoli]MBB3072880.1 ribosomal protein S18 acetylase RimI-like enzyme [Paenibacillus baekrokdamisoli]
MVWTEIEVQIKYLTNWSDTIVALKNPWKSERLIFEDLKLQELEEVQELYESSSNISRWNGREPDIEYINQCYFKGDLPPGGKKENYKIQTIKTNEESNNLIGMLSIYHGYPRSDITYIAFMCVGNKYKKQGYGQEIINQLIIELTRLEYKEIRINVALKNWSALRFWIKLGFDKINGIFGDEDYSDRTYSNIELTRLL